MIEVECKTVRKHSHCVQEKLTYRTCLTGHAAKQPKNLRSQLKLVPKHMQFDAICAVITVTKTILLSATVCVIACLFRDATVQYRTLTATVSERTVQ